MPAITTIGSLSSQSLGAVAGTLIRRSVTGTFVYPPNNFTISPAVDGSTTANLANVSNVALSTCSSTWNITPSSNFFANVKIWGAGGGGAYKYNTAPDLQGGNGGYSRAIVEFKVGVTYQFIVGCGGSAGTGTRPGAGGGGASAIVFAANNVPVLVAGGGGGSGSSGAYDVGGGDGGGTTGVGGSIGPNQGAGGFGGGQSDAGGGGYGDRRGGGNGSGRNGGVGASGGASGTGGVGGTGFGNGGAGGAGGSDDGSGGGGGGYFGGGGGGGSSDGGGGGGGSGYFNRTHALKAVLTQGYGTDPDRGTAGTGGVASTAGTDGKIVIRRHI